MIEYMHIVAWLLVPFVILPKGWHAFRTHLQTSACIVYMGQTNNLIITHVFWMESVWVIHDHVKTPSLFLLHARTHSHNTHTHAHTAGYSSSEALSGRSGPSQLCDDDKLHPPHPSIISNEHTLIHGYTLRLLTLPPALQRRSDSCGAACQRCHADRSF